MTTSTKTQNTKPASSTPTGSRPGTPTSANKPKASISTAAKPDSGSKPGTPVSSRPNTPPKLDNTIPRGTTLPRSPPSATESSATKVNISRALPTPGDKRPRDRMSLDGTIPDSPVTSKQRMDSDNLTSVKNQHRIILEAAKDISNYNHSPESKLNKVQANMLQDHLDAITSAAEEMVAQNAYLAEQQEALKNQQLEAIRMHASYAQVVADTPTPTAPVDEWRTQKPKRQRPQSRNKPLEVTPSTSMAAPATGPPTLGKNKNKIKSKPVSDEEIRNSILQENNLLLIDLPDAKEANEFMSEVKAALNPRETGIVIRDIRSTAKGGVAVRADTEEDKLKILNMPQFGTEGFHAKQAPKRSPRLLILRVPKYLTRLELKEQLLSRNNFGNRWTAEEVKPLYTVRYGRVREGADFVSWVVELNCDAWKQAKNQGRVVLDFLTCHVRNFLEVTRCFRCQAYGHTTKACPSQEPVCAQCSGEKRTRDRTSLGSGNPVTSKQRVDSSLWKVLDQHSAITSAISAIRMFIHNPDSKVNKTQALMLEEHLEMVTENSDLMLAHNAYLAGRVDSLLENQEAIGSMSKTIAAQISKDIKNTAFPSTSPVLQKMTQVQEDLKRLNTPTGHHRLDEDALLAAVSKVSNELKAQQEEIAKRHEEVLMKQQDSYAQALISMPGTSTATLGEQWTEIKPRRRRKEKEQTGLNQHAIEALVSHLQDLDTEITPTQGQKRKPISIKQLKSNMRSELDTRGGPAPSRPCTTIIVEAEDGGDVPTKLTAASIKPSDLGILPGAIRPIRGGLVAIDLPEDKTAESILNNDLLKQAGFKSRTAPSRFPKMVLRGVPSTWGNTELEESFINSDLPGTSSDVRKSGFTPLYRFGPKGNPTVSWVAQVSPAVRQAIKATDRLNLGWFACKDLITGQELLSESTSGNFLSLETPTGG
ncbi:hypothetical protein GE061_020341 [Apolygus lucorum]|uniref:CCHC-type domain-containing protein n=1 Tax=Apolygus lucorum TaxID=248454 RepID=A0A8S9WLU4_APOLU|nr:hypothetical protein GE061_020341 [Apolygus lucorum]